MNLTARHTSLEDVIAILSGTFIVAQGVFFLQQAGLLTGGTTGLALLLNQFVDLSFGTLYFLLNLPFYVMAWQRFGRQFALRSVFAGAMVAIITDNIGYVFSVDWLSPVYCALIGGLLMGVGMLMIFRHNASLGGSMFWPFSAKKSLGCARVTFKWVSIYRFYSPRFSSSRLGF